MGFLQASSPAVFLLLSCLALCSRLFTWVIISRSKRPRYLYIICVWQAVKGADSNNRALEGYTLYMYDVWQAGFRFDRYVVYGQRLWLSGYFCRMFIFFSFILIPLWTPCQLRFSHLRAFFDCSCSHILFVLPGGNDRRVDSLSFFYFLSHLPVL